MIFCAGGCESFARPLGIGSVNAAMGLLRYFYRGELGIVDEVVFAGSAGVYDKGLALFELREFKEAFNKSAALLEGLAYELGEGQRESGCGLKLNSLEQITASSRLCELFCKNGFWGENMEAFGFFAAAKLLGLKARVILISTNYCDEGAHEAFLQNHKKAMSLLESALVTA